MLSSSHRCTPYTSKRPSWTFASVSLRLFFVRYSYRLALSRFAFSGGGPFLLEVVKWVLCRLLYLTPWIIWVTLPPSSSALVFILYPSFSAVSPSGLASFLVAGFLAAVPSARNGGGGFSHALFYVLSGLYDGLFADCVVLYPLCLFRPLGRVYGG